jgi:hypothetical protein
MEIWHTGFGKTSSNWETIKSGVPQGSILGPLLFLLYINDLPSGIGIDCKLLLYADDTSLLISGPDICDIQTQSMMVLDNLNNWFTKNGLSLSLKKTKLMKFISNYLNSAHFQILYHDSLLHEEPNYKFLGLELDKHMNWKMHIKFILPKLSSACHAVRCMKHYC